jgi:regulator of nucleoside diphosphate kinase
MAKISITQFDKDRLLHLLEKRKPHDSADQALVDELAKADIVEASEVPADVITMNSHVRFEDEDGGTQEYWLVFPEDADINTNKISVLSPIGCALLGYGIGDTIELKTPSGTRKLKVTEILSQPEREGKYNL